jgi:hypothetical protein
MVERPVIRVGANKILNGGMDRWGSPRICGCPFKVCSAQIVKLSCCPEEGGRRNVDN